MLPEGRHVREVYLGAGRRDRRGRCRGALLIDCSTIDVATARAVGAGGRRARPGDGRRAGLGRRRRRRERDAHLHGRRRGGRGRAGAADPRAARHDHRAHRAVRQRPGGQDLQQHDARHLDDRRRRGVHHGRAPGPERRGPVRGRQPLLGAVLGADQLLPGAGAGADLAGQPRLSGRVHRGDDGQGPAPGAGCGATASMSPTPLGSAGAQPVRSVQGRGGMASWISRRSSR